MSPPCRIVGTPAWQLIAAPAREGSRASATWWTACLITLVLVLVLAAVGWRLQGGAKAIMSGAAAGLGFGLQAAVTKTFVTEVGGGLLGILSSWSVYVLIVSAVVGFVLYQNALKTGVLAPAMASSNAVTLFSSVVFGAWIYGEVLSKNGGGDVGAAVIGLLVAVVGIALLAGSAQSPGEPTAKASVATNP